jgi:hypothetical protein
MASLYILKIEDQLVGPCLELIRRLSQPESTSKPHVTVRGPIRRKNLEIPERWTAPISRIDLVQPGLFVSPQGRQSARYTVFLLCDLDKHLWIHQKPDYPTSLPHITLYDGSSKTFSEQLYDLLQKYPWRITVRLPADTRISKISLNTKGGKPKNPKSGYDSELKALFNKIADHGSEPEHAERFSTTKRLDLISRICGYLAKETSGSRRLSVRKRDKLRIEQQDGSQMLYALDRSYRSKQEELQLLHHSYRQVHSFTPREYRSRLGQFLTPPELAIQIVEFIKTKFHPTLPINFGDPSIGTGTFFSALRQVYSPNMIGSAIGVEIDNAIASTTKRLWGGRGLTVIAKDFFLAKGLDKRNLILCNPPYVRHHYISSSQKAFLSNQVRAELGIEISGLSSLYVYFMLSCHKWLAENGIAAWLVPSEFMDAKYGAALRQYLTERVTLLHIHRFDPRELQFEGVNVTSLVVIFRNRLPDARDIVHCSFDGTMGCPRETIELSIRDLRTRQRWPTYADQIESGMPLSI